MLKELENPFISKFPYYIYPEALKESITVTDVEEDACIAVQT